MSSQVDLTDVQRPNAVGSLDGPYLLRGLMLPLPPSKNGAWRSLPMVKKGTTFPLHVRNFGQLMATIRSITYRTDEFKDYVKTIREIGISKRFLFDCDQDLSAEIVICPRDRREVDAHNYHMVLLDALQEATVFQDDGQIKQLSCALGPIIPGGRAVISLNIIKHDAQAALDRIWRR